MAHFAEIDNNNRVIRVIVVNNSVLLDANGQESEALGQAFCNTLLGGGPWIQTSYNGSFRKNYAGTNYTYDAQLDAFVPPRPWPSWQLDQQNCQWQPPVPYPTDGFDYHWDEVNTTWVRSQ
jgi:hypothetical protein